MQKHKFTFFLTVVLFLGPLSSNEVSGQWKTIEEIKDNRGRVTRGEYINAQGDKRTVRVKYHSSTETTQIAEMWETTVVSDPYRESHLVEKYDLQGNFTFEEKQEFDRDKNQDSGERTTWRMKDGKRVLLLKEVWDKVRERWKTIDWEGKEAVTTSKDLEPRKPEPSNLPNFNGIYRGLVGEVGVVIRILQQRDIALWGRVEKPKNDWIWESTEDARASLPPFPYRGTVKEKGIEAEDWVVCQTQLDDGWTKPDMRKIEMRFHRYEDGNRLVITEQRWTCNSNGKVVVIPELFDVYGEFRRDNE